MSHLRSILRVSGFSKQFCAILDEREDLFGYKGCHQPGFMVVIDEANLLRFVLEDFTRNGKQLQTLSYTNLSLEALREDDLKDTEHCRTVTVGPGLHAHNIHNVFFCYENADIQPLMNSGVHKYVNRAAIVSLVSLETVQEYLLNLQKHNEEEKKLKLYVCQDMEWQQQKVPLRLSHTLFVGKIWQEVYEDAKEFLLPETKKFYADHGTPYVRSYLFHGQPGCGKSSTAKVLASELKLDLYSLSLTLSRMDDMSLMTLLYSVDTPAVVSIEDIDRVFDNFSSNQTSSSVSFSMLLNLMDGPLAREGLIFILTCNDYAKLDDAIKRFGRIDREFEFPHVSLKTIEKMFLSYYPKKKSEAKLFVTKLKKDRHVVGQTPACTFQEFFLRNRKRKAEEVICELDPQFFKKRRVSTVEGFM